MKGVYYRGKKFPFKYENPSTGKLEFKTRDVVWMANKAADFLIQTSPTDFVIADTKEDAPEEKPHVLEEEKNPLGLKEIVCRKCGHVSFGRSDAAKHQHQCKGIADGDGIDNTDTA